MNKPKPVDRENPNKGLGYEGPGILEKVSGILPILYLEPNSEYYYKPAFLKSTSEELIDEETKTRNANYMAAYYDYEKLNESYVIREVSLSTDYFSLFPEEELEKKHSQENVYVPPIFFEKKISDLQKALELKQVSFDNERQDLLQRITELEKTINSSENERNTEISSLKSNKPIQTEMSEREFDRLMNSDDNDSLPSCSNQTTNESPFVDITDSHVQVLSPVQEENKSLSSTSDSHLSFASDCNRSVPNNSQFFVKHESACKTISKVQKFVWQPKKQHDCVLTPKKSCVVTPISSRSNTNVESKGKICKIKPLVPTPFYKWVPKDLVNHHVKHKRKRRRHRRASKLTSHNGPIYKWVASSVLQQNNPSTPISFQSTHQQEETSEFNELAFRKFLDTAEILRPQTMNPLDQMERVHGTPDIVNLPLLCLL